MLLVLTGVTAVSVALLAYVTKTQLAEETELLKEFQAAETDQEKEELINGAGNDYTTQQIEQLEREITALKEEITEYQANVDRLQTAIDAAEDALAE